MKDPKKITQNPSTTEQEILKRRRFDLSEAIGRQAGGALKGASPVAQAQRLMLDVDEMLERHLPDEEGSLSRIISLQLESDPARLAAHFGDAPGLLREFAREILDSSTLLDELVRQADARWGRDYQERPIFNHPDQPAHPDDPYTPASVRASLEFLQAGLPTVSDQADPRD